MVCRYAANSSTLSSGSSETIEGWRGDINESRSEDVGKAGLLFSLAPEKARLNRSRQMLITYFVLDFILLLGLGSFVLSRIVVNPINLLLTATEKITGGQYGQRLNVHGDMVLTGWNVGIGAEAGTEE